MPAGDRPHGAHRMMRIKNRKKWCALVRGVALPNDDGESSR